MALAEVIESFMTFRVQRWFKESNSYASAKSTNHTIQFTSRGVEDRKGQWRIRYEHIDQIQLGKNTRTLEDQPDSHALYFSIVDVRNPTMTIDLSAEDIRQRSDMVMEIMDRCPQLQTEAHREVVRSSHGMNRRGSILAGDFVTEEKSTPSAGHEVGDVVKSMVSDKSTMSKCEVWQWMRDKKEMDKTKSIHRMLYFRNNGIVDGKGFLIIRWKQIHQIGLGKTTGVLEDQHGSHALFMSFIDTSDVTGTISLSFRTPSERSAMAIEVINHCKQLECKKNKEAIQSVHGKDRICVITMGPKGSRRGSRVFVGR